MAEPNPYIKTLEDELDWKLLDQLHNIVSQISSFCFEIKKFCVTTEFVVLTLIVRFTGDKLDHSLFVTGAIIALSFWFLDAVAYYYQVKLRGTMDAIQSRLRSRQSKKIVGIDTWNVIAPNRVNVSWANRAFNAGFNHSMWLYGFLVLIDFALWLLFLRGGIATNG